MFIQEQKDHRMQNSQDLQKQQETKDYSFLAALLPVRRHGIKTTVHRVETCEFPLKRQIQGVDISWK